MVLLVPKAANADWFDKICDGDDKEAPYRAPKGSDLHNHLTSAVFAARW